VKYDAARELMATGDLLAWSHRPWHSWYDFQIQMVRMFTQSEYSHVGVAWVTEGRVFVIEAVSRGVCITPLSNTGEFYWVPCQHEAKNMTIDWLMQQVGKPYKNKLQMVMDFFTGKPTKQVDRFQCSELANEFYSNSGLFLNAENTPSSIVNAALRMWNTSLVLIEKK
jgi:uncharacterized protein YycO